MPEFNINDIKLASDKLGIDMKVNSDNPGFHYIDGNGNTQIINYDQLEKLTKEIFNPSETIEEYQEFMNVLEKEMEVHHEVLERLGDD